MFRAIVMTLSGLAALLPWATRASAQVDDSSSVSIELPPTVRSETVQISYFLVGPFGGYGSYAPQRFGVTSYQIPAVVDGKAATEIRAIVYASGCEIQKLVIPFVEHSHMSREFVCQPVEMVRLSGQIVPKELAKCANAEIVVTYMAVWAHSFFGIGDGPITHFELATMSPRADGWFDVSLPLVGQQVAPSQPQSSICLMLRDSRTWNHIAPNLEPDDAELKSIDRCLQTRTSYPSDINFTAPRFEKSNLKGKVFRSDSGEAVSNSYILLGSETGEAHFDTRTDETGNYVFGHVPAGSYTVSIYAWFPKRDDVPSRNALGQKTAYGGEITVEWQSKSRAFMEIVTIRGLSIESDSESVRNFDLVGR